ncbi:beta family protein [Pseudomonas caspiana]|uniref:beta family protein n=1 Tax=Pseudomonas caspiana TaxID=1451454 RepID=UPI0032EC89A4
MHKFPLWKYMPILAIGPAEMMALEQLPDKDKDQMLPVFPLKGWLGAHRLENTIKRIEKSIGKRQWIADIDEKFLSENKVFLFTGSYPSKPVFQEVAQLLNPKNGYENWFLFVKGIENAVPCLQHEHLEESENQIQKLSSLDRGLVLRIQPNDANLEKHSNLIKTISRHAKGETLVIYDLENIDSNFEERIYILEKFIIEAKNNLANLTIAISSTSFPSGFAGQSQGENSIYERILFNTVEQKNIFSPVIYSDRGSTRAQKQSGGAGTPPPRIDYPLKKDWKFVRREVDDDAPNSKERRKAAYIEIAQEITNSNYWIPELRLWGTQQIEITADSNDFGVYTPQKSTAVRINIHLFNQLHYNQNFDVVNTDEEWVD